MTRPGRPRTITPDQDQRIADAYQNGASIRALAKAEGLSATGVRYVLARTGTQMRTNTPATDPGGHIAQQYRDGAPIDAIATATGRARSTVYVILRRAGVQMRPRGARPADERRRAAAAAAHAAFLAAHRTDTRSRP